MKAVGEVNTKVMNQLADIFFKCLMESVADIRTDVIASHTMPLLTGELQESQVVVPVQEDEIRLYTTAQYSEALYEKDKLHQTIEAHLDNDMCLEKAEQYGGVRANPLASGHWYDTYLDGDKASFAKEKFSEHLRKELVK